MKRKGFTLVEIMIVVGIIGLLAGLAIPNLLRARVNANESSALSSLRTVASAANTYRAVNPTYPADLTALSGSTPPYIDAVLGSGTKQGYNFFLAGSTYTFSGTARPQGYGVGGTKSFFVDESGVIRYTASDADATASDNPID